VVTLLEARRPCLRPALSERSVPMFSSSSRSQPDRFVQGPGMTVAISKAAEEASRRRLRLDRQHSASAAYAARAG